jgi:transposase
MYSIVTKSRKRQRIKRMRRKKRESLLKLVAQELTFHPFHTVRSLRTALSTPLSLASVSRAIHDAGFSRKKASWRVCPRNMETEKRAFKHDVLSRMKDRNTIVALDETGFVSTQMPIKGYSPVGSRLRSHKLQTARIHLSCAMAIDTTGRVEYTIKDGAFNGESFQEFLTALVPRTRTCPSGAVLIMDNVAFHKSRRVGSLVREKGIGQIMFSPPYSPECNPVERLFGLVKHQMRRLLLHVRITSREQFAHVVRSAIATAQTAFHIPSFFSMSEI